MCQAENMRIFYQNNDNTDVQNKTKAEHTEEGKILDATNKRLSEMCKYGSTLTDTL